MRNHSVNWQLSGACSQKEPNSVSVYLHVNQRQSETNVQHQHRLEILDFPHCYQWSQECVSLQLARSRPLAQPSSHSLYAANVWVLFFIFFIVIIISYIILLQVSFYVLYCWKASVLLHKLSLDSIQMFCCTRGSWCWSFIWGVGRRLLSAWVMVAWLSQRNCRECIDGHLMQCQKTKWMMRRGYFSDGQIELHRFKGPNESSLKAREQRHVRDSAYVQFYFAELIKLCLFRLTLTSLTWRCGSQCHQHQIWTKWSSTIKM